MSLAPYWWPNPDTEDGLPYIRRDGERNQDIYKITDRRNLSGMIHSVQTLALAHYLTGEEHHAAKAADVLRTWFLDPDTRMNPNLQYAQAVPGHNTGRGIGLIETAGLTEVVDAAGLIEGSDAWTDDDQRALRDWFSTFLTWMRESDHGRDEAAARNNHGTYYDLQVASFTLFVGKPELARSVLDDARDKRVAAQIEPDGSQPLELERTRSWSYSLMNLRGLMSLARLSEHVGVDLWNFETDDGRGIRKALDFLIPFAFDDEEWSHEQIGGFSSRAIHPLIRRAALKYPDGRYRDLLGDLRPVDNDSRSRLTDAAVDVTLREE
jgi:hypothetical protein